MARRGRPRLTAQQRAQRGSDAAVRAALYAAARRTQRGDLVRQRTLAYLGPERYRELMHAIAANALTADHDLLLRELRRKVGLPTREEVNQAMIERPIIAAADRHGRRVRMTRDKLKKIRAPGR